MKTLNSKLGTIEYGRTAVRPYGQNRGVTLVEMATVVGMILIMVAIGTAIWMNQSDRAYRNSAVYSTRDLVTAMKMYRTDNGDYPLGPGLTPLLVPVMYTNVTTLRKDYNALTLVKVGNAVCLQGALKGIQPEYFTALCAEPDEAGAAEYKAANQPACCWTKGGVDCSNAANWYKCEKKM